MPKGKRGKGTMQNGGIVQVIWRGKILLGGPSSIEKQMRDVLEEELRLLLEECNVFAASGLAAEYAFRIAWGVTYQIRERHRARDSRGRFVKVHPVMQIRELDVIYRNPPKDDKWWLRIRDGENTVEPGAWVNES